MGGKIFEKPIVFRMGGGLGVPHYQLFFSSKIFKVLFKNALVLVSENECENEGAKIFAPHLVSNVGGGAHSKIKKSKPVLTNTQFAHHSMLCRRMSCSYRS